MDQKIAWLTVALRALSVSLLRRVPGDGNVSRGGAACQPCHSR